MAHAVRNRSTHLGREAANEVLGVPKLLNTTLWDAGKHGAGAGTRDVGVSPAYLLCVILGVTLIQAVRGAASPCCRAGEPTVVRLLRGNGVIEPVAAVKLVEVLTSRRELIGLRGPAKSFRLLGGPALPRIPTEHLILKGPLTVIFRLVAGVAHLPVILEVIKLRVLLASRVGSRHSVRVEPDLLLRGQPGNISGVGVLQCFFRCHASRAVRRLGLVAPVLKFMSLMSCKPSFPAASMISCIFCIPLS